MANISILSLDNWKYNFCLKLTIGFLLWLYFWGHCVLLIKWWLKTSVLFCRTSILSRPRRINILCMQLKIKILRSLQLRRGFGTIQIRNSRLPLLKVLVTAWSCKWVFGGFYLSVFAVFHNLMFSCSDGMLLFLFFLPSFYFVIWQIFELFYCWFKMFQFIQSFSTSG